MVNINTCKILTMNNKPCLEYFLQFLGKNTEYSNTKNGFVSATFKSNTHQIMAPTMHISLWGGDGGQRNQIVSLLFRSYSAVRKMSLSI